MAQKIFIESEYNSFLCIDVKFLSKKILYYELDKKISSKSQAFDSEFIIIYFAPKFYAKNILYYVFD